jgi:hypothetical protein
MRRSARTDLCGGRSAMIVPTATAKHRHYDYLSLLVNWLLAATAQIGAILLTSQFSDACGERLTAAPGGQFGHGRHTFSERP